MKRKENNLDKNISRLVKLTRESDIPSEKFVDSLINDALNELDQPQHDQQRDERNTTMKFTLKKPLAWAAAFIVVSALAASIMMPRLGKVKEMPMKLAINDRTEQQVPQSVETPKPAATVTDRLKSGRDLDGDASAVVAGDDAYIEFTGGTSASVSDSKNGSDLKSLGDVASKPVPRPKAKPAPKLVVAKKPQPMFTGTPKSTARGAAGGAVARARSDGTTVVYTDAISYDMRGGVTLKERPASTIGGRTIVVDNGGSYGDRRSLGLAFHPAPGQPPMAHGGTTPPNGEDVDAMFFKNYGVNPFVDTEDDHLSTFATDVDTGSYSVARKYLHDGHMPPNEAVRVEEFVNYFDYRYPAPQEDTFAVYAEACPWQFGEQRKNIYLMRLGLKAQEISEENRKPAVLTFVIDVSGSMNRENRLELVKKSLNMLVDRLRPDDRIGIAVYGSRGKKIIDHKRLDEKEAILEAIRSLHPGGSTYAEEGIRIGYDMADKAFKKGCINRVILCSDGVANVGNTGVEKILEIVKGKAAKGITLSTLGFGMGNYNDVLMEQLGNKGDGYYAYIDTIAEAKKLFGKNLTGTLQVIARDVKIQVDFNPDVVRSYRLIGYENRDVADKDFRNDTVDGGEMGAGHAATALYELKLWPEKKGTIATTYVRYKHPDTREVTEFSSEFKTKNISENMETCSNAFKLASTVTEFAEILRKSYWAKGAKLDDVLSNAQAIGGNFAGDTEVIELIDLIAKAKKLTPNDKIDDLKPAEIIKTTQD